MEHVAGCRACIITLECGTEMETDRIFLKADGDSCETTGATRLNLTLADPLAAIFNLINIDDDLPQFPSLTQARQHLVAATRLLLTRPHVPTTTTAEHLQQIAAPIAAGFRTDALKFSTPRRALGVWRESVIVGVASCCLSLVLQALAWYCLYQWAHRRELEMHPAPPSAPSYIELQARKAHTHEDVFLKTARPTPHGPYPTLPTRTQPSNTSVNGRVLGADCVVALGRASARPAEHARFTRTGMSPSLCALPRLEETQP